MSVCVCVGGVSFCNAHRISVFRICLCHTVLSVPGSLVVNYSERADLLALLYVIFSCVFVTFPYGDLGQVWNLVLSIPHICLLPYLNQFQTLDQ